MESVEITLRNLRPQPVGKSTVPKFSSWRTLLLKDIERIQRERGGHHPIGTRLDNMVEFVSQQLASITRVEGSAVFVEAGKFHWFLCRLLQREESMKALLRPGDPFIRELDPRLRKRIKARWDAVSFQPNFHRLVDRLHLVMRRERDKARSNKALHPAPARAMARRRG